MERFQRELVYDDFLFDSGKWLQTGNSAVKTRRAAAVLLLLEEQSIRENVIFFSE